MLMNNKTQPADRGAAIYKALWHAIIEQALQPGAKLPEDAIGEKFGASRTIVRRRRVAATRRYRSGLRPPFTSNSRK
jgi:DNA-binding GntR family transcriptional regulator